MSTFATSATPHFITNKCLQNFKIQLGPFTDVVQSSGSGSFKWIDGGYKAVPPPGFDDYFGAPPLFRFMDYDGVTGLDDMMVKIRDFPKGLTPEDTIRKLLGEDELFPADAVHDALNRLHEIIDQDPEIDVCLACTVISKVRSSRSTADRLLCRVSWATQREPPLLRAWCSRNGDDSKKREFPVESRSVTSVLVVTLTHIR